MVEVDSVWFKLALGINSSPSVKVLKTRQVGLPRIKLSLYTQLDIKKYFHSSDVIGKC